MAQWHRSSVVFASVVIMGLTITSAAAAADQWSGYKPIEKATGEVREFALEHIVRLVMPDMTDEDIPAAGKYTVVDPNRYPVVTDPNLLAEDLEKFQIETCRRQGFTQCPVFASRFSASGFIGGRVLYTCRHTVNNWTAVAGLLNSVPPRQVIPALQILSPDGKPLYNSALSSEIAGFKSINDDNRVPSLMPKSGNVDFMTHVERVFFSLSEFASLTIPRELERPYFTVGTIEVGDPVYAAGFPAEAKGHLVASSGKVRKQLAEWELLSHTAEQTPGMSGGAVIDANGDPIAIACTQTSFEEDTYNSVVLDELGALRLWKQMKAIFLK